MQIRVQIPACALHACTDVCAWGYMQLLQLCCLQVAKSTLEPEGSASEYHALGCQRGAPVTDRGSGAPCEVCRPAFPAEACPREPG